MPTLNLTMRSIDAAKPPKTGRAELWDRNVRGLGFRVTSNGHKSWCLMYRVDGRLRRHTLGAYPAVSLAKARSKALKALAQVADGLDPAADKIARRQALTFRELANEYLEKHAKANKRSWKKDESILNRDVLPRIGDRKVPAVTKRDIIEILDRIAARGAPIASNRTFEVIRKIFNWAVSRGLAENSPCVGVTKLSKERTRERVLSNSELRKFWNGLEKGHISPEVRLQLKLQLVTAQRKGEVIGAGWGEFDLEAKVWTIPASRSKNGRAHRVPLTKTALQIIDKVKALGHAGEWLFPSPKGIKAKNGSKKSISAAAVNRALMRSLHGMGLDNVTPHDLRRSAATYMAQAGVGRVVLAKVLNHVSADRNVTAIYDRHGYDKEKRQALQIWERRLKEILGR